MHKCQTFKTMGKHQENLSLLTYGLYLVCSGNKNRQSGYVCNTVMQVTADPARIAVACNKDNYTASIIEEAEAFSVSVLLKDSKPIMIGRFGFKSGKDTDKFGETEHFTGKTGVPVVSEDSLAWYECKLIDIKDVGSHLVYFGELVDSGVFKEEGEALTYGYYKKEKKGRVPKNAPTFIQQ